MTVNILISIVVPVYKVKEYITDCISSILQQSYPYFELILVDDGSPDNCGEICDQFALQDKRIYVIHKQNGGLSDARNAGINVAKGEYITFVDSDDFLHQDYLKQMIDMAESTHADIIQCGFTSDKESLGAYPFSQEKVCSFSSEEALHDLLRMNTVQVNAWAKLYKTDLFHGIRYPYGRINEDNLTTYKLILAAHSSVVCSNQNLYFYRVNPDGIMHSSFSDKRYEILSFADEITDYLGDDVQKYKSDIEYSEMRLAIRLYNECIRSGNHMKYINYQQKIREFLSNYQAKQSICGNKYYIMLKLLKWNWRIYNWIIGL